METSETTHKSLIAIKLLHTLIWVVMAGATVYVLYSGCFNRITRYTWMAIGLILFEGLVLLLFKWTCPLTVVARRYSDSPKDNFDIYLPNWLARYNKLIFTSIYVVGLVLVLVRALGARD